MTVCAFSTTALAETCDDASPIHPGVATNNGVAGTWLSPQDANRVFFVLTTCTPQYRALIASQAKLIAAQHELVRTSSAVRVELTRLSRDEHDRAEFFKTAYDEQSKRLQEERAASDSLIRSPVLWFAIGAAAVGLSVGAGIAIVNLSRGGL